MAVQIQHLYNNVVRTLLEDSGFQTLGIMTNEDFFNYANDVLQDFLSRTGSIKKFVVMPTVYDVGTYPEPDNAMDIQGVYLDNAYIARSSGWYMDNYNSDWQAESGTVERWREDELPPKSIQFDPIPLIQGDQVVTTPSNFGYGQIAATSNPVDFDVIAVTGPGYGTISSGDGLLPGGTNAVYLEALNAGYGLISSMTATTTNIQLVATMQPVTYPQQLSDYIEMLPDSFIVAIKYGILAKIFSGDTEYKDNARGKYCMDRYKLGIDVVTQIMLEMGVE